MGAELGITPVIIRGEELKQKGFGGTVTVDIYVKLIDLSLILVLYLHWLVYFLCKINTHLKDSHLFRHLWGWQGSRTSSCISSPEPQT